MARGADGLRGPRRPRARVLGRVVRVRARPRRRAGRGTRRVAGRRRRCPTSCSPGSTPLAVVDERGVVTAARRRSRSGAARPRGRRRGRRPARRARRRSRAAQWRTSLDRDEYRDRVETILELLRAGECYQVNLTRRLTCDRRLDPVALYAALAYTHPAPTPALLHLPSRRAGHRGGLGVAGALPAPARRAESRPGRSRAPRPRARALLGQRQGPRRERDDRRPRPQRPRPRVRARVDPRAGAVRGRVAPRAAPPREHGARPAARRRRHRRAGRRRRSRRRRSPARPSRACSRPSKTSSRCAAASTAARSGWIDTDATGDADLAVAIRTFTVLGAGDTGAPTSASAAASSPTRNPTPSGRETELKAQPAPRASRAPTIAASGRVVTRGRRDRRSGSTARCSPPTRRGCRRSTTGCSSATASSRPSGSTAGSRSRGPVTSIGSRTPPPGSGSRSPTAAQLRAAADAVLAANGHVEAAAADHRHRRASRRSAPSAASAGPTVIVASSAVHAVAGVGAGGRGAVGAQRPRRDRRAEDHVVRGERARARVRARARRERGDLRQHPRRAVRGHRLQRVRRARRCACAPRRDRRVACSACTRALVLELARDARHRDRRDGRSRSTRSRDADEAFLTSTTREVQPISARRRPRAARGRPGPSPPRSPPRSPPSSPATSTPTIASRSVRRGSGGGRRRRR